MKRNRWLWSCALAACLAGTAMAEELVVQVREAPVYEKSSPISKVQGMLKFGDVVSIKESLGAGWKRVESKPPSTLAGWMRTSAVTEAAKMNNKNTFGGTATATKVEANEAGDGFGEKEYRDYVSTAGLANAAATLDAIERSATTKVSPQQVVQFLNAGGLQPKEGK